MLTLKDILDIEDEIYKLEGISNLLSAWSNEDGGFESSFLSSVLNDTVKTFQRL